MKFEAAGFVLAGGLSSRMGREKALLELDGETLLERNLRSLAEVCREVAIAGGSADLARFGRLIPDERIGEGPLSGIVAALEASAIAWNLFCPVDVPFVPPQAWVRLLESALARAADVVVARVCGQVQPLCGVYHRRVAPALRAQLDAGQRKVTAAIESAGTVFWVDFDQPGAENWFHNLNTPEDYQRLAHPKR